MIFKRKSKNYLYYNNIHKDMKKQMFILSSVMILMLLFSILAFSQKSTDRVAATNDKAKKTVSVRIPPHAIEVANNVFSLGTATDVDGSVVEGIMIIHKKSNAKPPWAGGGKGDTSPTCYSFLAKDAKWKDTEPWIVNPENTQELNSTFVLNNLQENMQKWETASGANILGSGSITSTLLIADESSPDGVNEVYFGSIDSPGAIAVTITWGIFSGPPKNRRLVEWDQVYDQIDYAWSTSGDPNNMDFENIATHEIGHAVGMGHPPSDCVEETMYSYSDYGETKKRDLNSGDIEGITKLYK
jgi:hypothetical protein